MKDIDKIFPSTAGSPKNMLHEILLLLDYLLPEMSTLCYYEALPVFYAYKVVNQGNPHGFQPSVVIAIIVAWTYNSPTKIRQS